MAEQRADVLAGQQQLTWDGRDDYGQSVPPGLYLLELHIGGDAGEQRVRWSDQEDKKDSNDSSPIFAL